MDRPADDQPDHDAQNPSNAVADADHDPSDPTDAPEAALPRKGNPIRRLYEWCLSWADTPYGTPALFGISFTESSFFPIPPDLLQIALSASKPERSFFYAIVSLIASVLGAILGWAIGLWFWEALGPYFFQYVPGFSQPVFDKVMAGYQQNAFLAISLAAFTPIPFKIFTIASGVFQVPLWTLVLASFLARGARFFAVATIIYLFGPKVRELIDKYFNIATLLIGIAFVAGIVAIKFLH